MKIALITHHFPPHFRAGGEQYALRLAQGLYQRGCTLEVVTIESISEGELVPRCETDNQYGFPVHRLFFNLGHAPNQYEWSFRNPQLGEWVYHFLQQFQPDLVHVNSGYLLGGTVPEAAFALGLPTVLTLHDYWYVCPEITLLQRNGRICHEPVPAAACVWCALSTKRRYRLPDQWLQGRVSDLFVALSERPHIPLLPGIQARRDLVQERRRYLLQVFARFDRVISPSRFLLAKLAAYGLPIHHAVNIPVGLSDTHLPASAAATSHPLHIGYLGQIVPHKGVHLLIKAFLKLKKQPGTCQLTLYGQLWPKDKYQRQLRQLAANDPDIQFAGLYPNEEVGQILGQLDLIVVPSVWYENQPSVILEALATKTPVVATRLGGMAELITEEKNGLLFAVGDVAELTAQLQRCLDEPALLPQLRAGIEPIPSQEQELALVLELYEAIRRY